MEHQENPEQKDSPEAKDNAPVQKKPELPARKVQSWPTPKNTYAAKGRTMDRKPGTKGSARGR